MKLLIIILLIPLGLFCQKKYAPLGAMWGYEGHEFQCLGNHINYIVEKDTLIDEKDCSIIYSYTSNDLYPEIIKTGDSLIVWENENKVYFQQDSDFYLLFDFLAQIGDTIFYFEPISRGPFSSSINQNTSSEPNKHASYIKDIKENQLGNKNLKFFYVESIVLDWDICNEQLLIIENIGSTGMGLIGSQCVTIASGCFGGLQCYSNNEISFETQLNFETPNPSCDILDSSKKLSLDSKISIFPNPTSGLLKIETDKAIKKIDVLNIDGQLICSYNQTDQLHLDFLDKGIYLLSIKLESNTRTLKFFKD